MPNDTKKLIGWRICVGYKLNNGWIVRPIFQAALEEKCFIAVDLKLPKTGVHVGTSKEFCLDYYSGCSELKDRESELLLQLDCTGCVDNPDHLERWAWPCPTEALVTEPLILSIEVVTR